MLSRISRSRGRNGVVASLTVVVLSLFGCRSTQESVQHETYSKLGSAEVISNAVPYEALPLPLSDVRLTGGPLKHAQELDADYLLKLEPDRMLYYLRLRAGLEPKAKEGYGGWDGKGRQLTG